MGIRLAPTVVESLRLLLGIKPGSILHVEKQVCLEVCGHVMLYNPLVIILPLLLIFFFNNILFQEFELRRVEFIKAELSNKILYTFFVIIHFF